MSSAGPASQGGGWRATAGWICVVGFLLFAAVGLYVVAAFAYYQISGNLLGEFTAEDLQWAGFGQLFLGTLIWLGAFLWGAVTWVPDDPELMNESRGGLPDRQVADGRSERKRAPAPGRPTGADRTPPPRAESRARDEEMLWAIRDDPKMEAMAQLIERLLREQESRDHHKLAESERRSRRRDIYLLIIGTLLGLATPVASGWLLRSTPW